jgi:LacI family transcriptional regulator
MKKVRPSIGDLAKKLSVSKTAVSIILNGEAQASRFSDKLIKRVRSAAEKSGYHPNLFAQGLRTGKINIVGLMVEDISNPFYASIAKRIEEKVYQNGYKIAYCSTENDKQRGKEFLSMFTTMGMDGCIIAPTRGMEKEIKEMVDSGMHVVLFDRKFGNKATDSVMVDNRGGMYEAVKHLIDRGFTNIGLVALALDKPEKEDRVIGYNEAIADHGLTPYVFPLPFREHYLSYVEEIEAFLRKNRQLDAVVFGTNYLGISGLQAISRLDLRIPEDIAVVSFDDHDLFRVYKPNITVVAQPIEEIAQAAIDTLLGRMQNSEQSPVKNITLPTLLIARNSS